MMVSVCCLAYNHEKYIREAIDSVLSQKLNFEYEIIINDDCSTDGTRKIIEEYEKQFTGIIKPIYQKENQYSQGKRIFIDYLFPKAKGKYIALLECDDYWSDPYKLKKQIEYMEKNDDCALTFTATSVLDDKGIFREYYPDSCERDFSLSEIIEHDGGLIPTASMVFRSNLVNTFPDYCRYAPIEDWPQSVYYASRGRVHYLNIVTSVYRFNHPGSWTRNLHHSKNLEKYRKGMLECTKLMMQEFNEPVKSIVRKRFETQEFEYFIETGNLQSLIAKYKKRIKRLSLKNKIRIIWRFFCHKY